MTEKDENWFGPDAATFGDRLTAAREAAGMSQSKLARQLGIRKSTVEKWEEDLSEPRANRLVMLAGMLNVSVMWLMTGDGDGLAAPTDTQPLPADCREVLAELAALRTELRAGADRAARLEKRLRTLLVAGDAV